VRRPRASARVRRRRALVLSILAGVIVIVFAVTSSGSTTGHTPTRVRTSPRSPATTRVQAVPAAWVLPEPVSRATAIVDGAAILIVGGVDAQQATSTGVFRLDPTTGVLTPAGTLALPAHDAAGALISGRPFVFGGGAQTVVDAVQSLSSSAPATIAAHLPRPRADLAAVAIGNTAYIVGGYDGTTAAPDVLATTDGVTYRVVARLPLGVRYPAVGAIGNTVYVFGGEWAGTPTASVQAIDVRTGTARVVGRLPQARTQAAGFSIAGTLYVAGGLTPNGPSSDILRFDASRDTFVAAGSLPAPVADAAVAVIANRAYLIGGEAAAPQAGVTIISEATAPQAAVAAAAQRPFAGKMLIADRGDNRLIVVDAHKNVSWIYPGPGRPAPPGGFYFPDDGFFVDHGRSILSNEEENHTIVRIAYPSGALLWSYGVPKVPGSGAGMLNQPDDAFLLRDGRITVADAKNCRILFIGANAKPLSQIGTTGDCTHKPPTSLGYPNGDTPLANGNFLVSEINGSWISEYTATGGLVWTVHLPIAYPSDPQQLGPDLYLVADYTRPGGILEFNREGTILWTYRPASGEGMLDHPSLAERLPNGLIGVNDDYRHRVMLIDPSTKAVVWQYGQTDLPGTGFNQLNIPDGFDLLLPDNTTPLHSPTG
jgi:Galactose oxidase, central domain/Kelch motif/PQQ-like domain